MAKFSNVKINLFPKSYGKMIGNGSIDIAGILNLKFKLFDGPKGIFAGLPSTKGKDKEGKDTYYNDAKFISQEDYFEFQNVIVQTYNELKNPIQSNSNYTNIPNIDPPPIDNSYEDEIPF